MKHLAAKSLLVLFFSILAGWNSLVHAQDIPDPMNPPSLVNDFSGIFSEEQKQDLENLLRAYHDSTSTQIFVVTVDDLHGYAVSDFAFQVGEKWKIGQKGKNNGLVILIKPKIGNSRGDLYIATGYGLEAKLTDARCGRIMDQYMIPHFRDNDYYSGTKAGIGAIIRYLSGEFSADKKEEQPQWGRIAMLVIFVIIFVIFATRGSKGGGNNGTGGSQGGGGGWFFPPIIGGGGGRSSGGGFGGGGGGSFGGGGAGRSW